MVVLEELEHAKRRGAHIYGEIVGYGTTADAYRITDIHPQGRGAISCMQMAIRDAGLQPSDIHYVNAHGTGTPLNDSAEAVALQRWAGGRISHLPVSSTKASIGHLLGAAGAVEAVICLMAVREQWIPPQRSSETIDPDCST